MTDAERALWRELRRRGLDGARFHRQAPIGRFVVDFVCFERKLVIEVDGGQHGDRVAYNEARSEWLAGEGFRVLRFWNNDVLQNMEGVLEQVLRSIRT